MALLIENITSETDQVHTIISEDNEIGLRLRFHPAVQIWTMDITFAGQAVYGIQISIATLHIRGVNWPFDFAAEVTDNSGIPPFRVDDFANGRARLYILTRAEMLQVRGLDVPL